MVLLEEATREQLIEQVGKSFDEVVLIALQGRNNGDTEMYAKFVGDSFTLLGLMEVSKPSIMNALNDQADEEEGDQW